MATFMSGIDASETGWSIYTGFWINYSRGQILGSTLTATGQYGLVLVSFLALFVGALSGYTWGIVCFVSHQLRSTRVVEDGLYHQSQALLRNSQSPTATLWDMLKLGWVWRGRVRMSMWRVFALVIIAATQITFFAAAGILSSEIFSNTNEVLIRSAHCGYIPGVGSDAIGHYNESVWAVLNAYSIEGKLTADWAWNYAISCYSENPAASCNYMATRMIESTYANVTCPFADEVCLDPSEGGALQADSGYINSNLQLGINSPQKDSFDYRRVTTCAPLKQEGFLDSVKDTLASAVPGEVFYSFKYGDAIIVEGSNITTRYDFVNAYSPQVIDLLGTAFGTSYAVAILNNIPQSTFIPNDLLNRTDADVTVIFINNNAQYTSPTTDLWFDAQIQAELNTSYFGGYYYTSQYPVIAMGCTEQYQLCNPNLPREQGCTPLSGWSVVGADPIFNGTQLALGQEVYEGLSTNSLWAMIFSLGPGALLASLSLDSPTALFSNPLPAGHWQSEVQAWHSFLLAQTQKLSVNIASGLSNSEFNQFIIPPNDWDSSRFDICNNVKVRDSRYYSFNIFGLAITLVTGVIIIIIYLSLSSAVGWFQQVFNRGMDRKEDWELDSLLQIQRMAYESAKLGTWTNAYDDVPITIRALGEQKFGKPGRGKGAYEMVNLEPAGADAGAGAGASPGPSAPSRFSLKSTTPSSRVTSLAVSTDELMAVSPPLDHDNDPRSHGFSEYMPPMQEVYLADFAKTPGSASSSMMEVQRERERDRDRERERNPQRESQREFDRSRIDNAWYRDGYGEREREFL